MCPLSGLLHVQHCQENQQRRGLCQRRVRVVTGPGLRRGAGRAVGLCPPLAAAWVCVLFQPEMIGHYLGEFSITYKPVKHGRPGIGATHSSRFIPLK